MPTIRNAVLKESAFETAADWSVSHGRRFRANIIIIWGMRKHYSTLYYILISFSLCIIAHNYFYNSTLEVYARF